MRREEGLLARCRGRGLGDAAFGQHPSRFEVEAQTECLFLLLIGVAPRRQYTQAVAAPQAAVRGLSAAREIQAAGHDAKADAIVSAVPRPEPAQLVGRRAGGAAHLDLWPVESREAGEGVAVTVIVAVEIARHGFGGLQL